MPDDNLENKIDRLEKDVRDTKNCFYQFRSNEFHGLCERVDGVCGRIDDLFKITGDIKSSVGEVKGKNKVVIGLMITMIAGGLAQVIYGWENIVALIS